MKTFKLLFTIVAVMMAFPGNATSIKDNPIPVHRPLVEEYAGTWCGWCVRGLAGMELLDETFGDNYVGVVYHYNDAMATIAVNKFPNTITGFPSEFINRTQSVDPLNGTGNTSGGIVNAVSEIASEATIADLDISAQWTSEDKTDIAVNVSSYFTVDDNSGNYAIEVMLIANDLYGSGSGWNQTNKYSGDSDYAQDPYLSVFVNSPSVITGYHFNDIIVGTSGVISGSLPINIVAYDLYSYDHTFTISRLPKPSLIQNKDKLLVVAIIYDKTNKIVINANKAPISNFITSLPGDVNDDNGVNVGDIAAIIDYLLDNSAPINFTNADLNGDGIVNVADLSDLIDLILSN